MEEKGGAELLVMTLMNMLRNCISQDGRLKMQVPDCAADRDSNTSYKVVHLHSEELRRTGPWESQSKDTIPRKKTPLLGVALFLRNATLKLLSTLKQPS